MNGLAVSEWSNSWIELTSMNWIISNWQHHECYIVMPDLLSSSTSSDVILRPSRQWMYTGWFFTSMHICQVHHNHTTHHLMYELLISGLTFKALINTCCNCSLIAHSLLTGECITLIVAISENHNRSEVGGSGVSDMIVFKRNRLINRKFLLYNMVDDIGDDGLIWMDMNLLDWICTTTDTRIHITKSIGWYQFIFSCHDINCYRSKLYSILIPTWCEFSWQIIRSRFHDIPLSL